MQAHGALRLPLCFSPVFWIAAVGTYSTNVLSFTLFTPAIQVSPVFHITSITLQGFLRVLTPPAPSPIPSLDSSPWALVFRMMRRARWGIRSCDCGCWLPIDVTPSLASPARPLLNYHLVGSRALSLFSTLLSVLTPVPVPVPVPVPIPGTISSFPSVEPGSTLGTSTAPGLAPGAVGYLQAPPTVCRYDARSSTLLLS